MSSSSAGVAFAISEQDYNIGNPHLNATLISEIVAQVLSLHLHLPGENKPFLLKQYADHTSVFEILRQCKKIGIQSPDKVAYILATAWHESRLGTWMTESVREWSGAGCGAEEARKRGKTTTRKRGGGETNKPRPKHHRNHH